MVQIYYEEKGGKSKTFLGHGYEYTLKYPHPKKPYTFFIFEEIYNRPIEQIHGTTSLFTYILLNALELPIDVIISNIKRLDQEHLYLALLELTNIPKVTKIELMSQLSTEQQMNILKEM